MNIERVQYLREVLVAGKAGKTTSTIEFSYDDRFAYRRRFFGVPDGEVEQARRLYLEWGGSRPEGYRIGSTVSRPDTLATFSGR